MAINGRNKGAKFELDIARMLHLELGVKFSRDLRQYQQSDLGDLICEDDSFPFTLELKRYASGYTYQQQWWKQVLKAAEAVGKEPVLIYRFDRQPIVAVMRLAYLMQDESYEPYTVKLDWDGFIQITRESWT